MPSAKPICDGCKGTRVRGFGNPGYGPCPDCQPSAHTCTVTNVQGVDVLAGYETCQGCQDDPSYAEQCSLRSSTEPAPADAPRFEAGPAPFSKAPWRVVRFPHSTNCEVHGPVREIHDGLGQFDEDDAEAIVFRVNEYPALLAAYRELERKLEDCESHAEALMDAYGR